MALELRGSLPERLRMLADFNKGSAAYSDMMREAADEIDLLRDALRDATAFKTFKALNRARVLIGGPDMEKHAKGCCLYGDGRVECVPGCMFNDPPQGDSV